MAWGHPEIEWVMADGPTTASWKGVAGMFEGFGHWLSAWEDLHLYADDYRELDDERVFVLTHITGHGANSGLDPGEIRPEGAALFHLRGGTVTRLVQYNDREHALVDLGLAANWMRYRGGIARLETTVSFGHAQAVLQQHYGRSPAARPGTAWWKIAAVVGLILYGLLTTVLLLLRRRRRVRESAEASTSVAESSDIPERERESRPV